MIALSKEQMEQAIIRTLCELWLFNIKELQKYQQRRFRRIMQGWLNLIEWGIDEAAAAIIITELGRRYPNLSNMEINRIIYKVDQELLFELEENMIHWANEGFDMPPDFSRLKKGGRIAFIEDLLDAVNFTPERTICNSGE